MVACGGSRTWGNKMSYVITPYENYNIKSYTYRGGYRWVIISGWTEVHSSTDCNDMVWTTDEEAINNAKAYIDSITII